MHQTTIKKVKTPHRMGECICKVYLSWRSSMQNGERTLTVQQWKTTQFLNGQRPWGDISPKRYICIKLADKHMKWCLTSLVIREMLIKTTVTDRFTPTGMAVVKKTENHKCWGVRNWTPHTRLWARKMVQLLGKAVRPFPKHVKHRITTWPGKSTPRFISKRTENKYSNKNVYIDVPSSIIHNNQKVKTTQMSIGSRMDKQCGLPEQWNTSQWWKKEVLICATTRVNPENIMYEVGEVRHRKSHTIWFHLYDTPRSASLRRRKAR